MLLTQLLTVSGPVAVPPVLAPAGRRREAEVEGLRRQLGKAELAAAAAAAAAAGEADAAAAAEALGDALVEQQAAHAGALAAHAAGQQPDGLAAGEKHSLLSLSLLY